MSRALTVVAALLVGACATHPAEPVVKTVEVKVPVAVACPDRRAPAPVLPDTPEALASALDVFALAQIVKAANILMHQRLIEDDAQVAACAKPGRPTG